MKHQELRDLIGQCAALANRIGAVSQMDDYKRVRNWLTAAASILDLAQARLHEAGVHLRGPMLQAPGHEVEDLDDVSAAMRADASPYPACAICRAEAYTQCNCLKVTT